MKKILVAVLISVLMLSLFPARVLAQNEGSTWSMYRPSSDTLIDQRAQNATTDEEASVGVGVHILRYFENAPDDPYGPDNDGVRLKVAATANTRKGINYQSSWGLGLMDWIEANTPIPGMDPPSDDSGAWIDLPFTVRFYGGPGAQNRSAEYHKVWVCSNGFLSFDCESMSPNSKSIPDPEEPNSLLAVYWSDLDPSGGSIKYYADTDYFVVTWRNVLDKLNGYRQTFEVIIENIRAPAGRGQNRIEFLYESVMWSDSARVGVEDQEGYKGAMPSPYPQSEESVWFLTYTEAPEIREMTIMVEKDDSYARIYTTPTQWSLRGCNLEYESQQHQHKEYEYAFKGLLTLLMSTALELTAPGSGLMFDVTLVSLDLAGAYARSTWPVHPLDYEDAHDPDQNIAYVNASAADTGAFSFPVDASLADQFEWVFTDDNDQDHSVTVTAELEYYSYQTFEIETISTSVDLSVKIGHTLTVRTYDLGENEKTGVDVWIDSTQYSSPVEVMVACGDHIVEVDPVFYRDNHKYTFQHWEGGDTSNPRTVSILEDTTLRAYYGETHVGGGGCPFIYTWNGTGYVIDNNLLGDSEASGGADVEDYYRLERPLVRKEAKYSLLIKEFEQEHSYLDQVRLMAVDHESDVHVAVSPTAEILTYKNPYAPVSAIDNHGNNTLDLVETIGDSYYRGQPDDYLLVDFGNLDVSNGAKLVLRADNQFKPDKLQCVHVQVFDATEGWMDVAVLRTRLIWATEIVDLSDYLPDADGELKVRLYFTGIHLIDYVGLDTTKQDDFNLHHANLVSAIHSEEGSIKTELLESDDLYAELVPGQQIELAFTLPENSEDARTFITHVEGHYYIIS